MHNMSAVIIVSTNKISAVVYMRALCPEVILSCTLCFTANVQRHEFNNFTFTCIKWNIEIILIEICLALSAFCAAFLKDYRCSCCPFSGLYRFGAKFVKLLVRLVQRQLLLRSEAAS